MSEMIHDVNWSCDFKREYDLNDALMDAKVLASLTPYSRLRASEVADAIIARLHKFYCGGSND
jgi:hypothetical protein